MRPGWGCDPWVWDGKETRQGTGLATWPVESREKCRLKFKVPKLKSFSFLSRSLNFVYLLFNVLNKEKLKNVNY